MAQQAYYQQQMAMAQKGPLQPGQTIKLSQHTVTVERYLSQGGFAHVYLVRTATPVMGTTQHVLKRMAVADVATLAEVKKEVDIMRLLRGHPNIVHLLDSASRPLPNGQHEVYILMEFCQGGGIIDMMNRRLRERLTEKDILQIFVDVCEAVACMHSLQPALLHRDLKVENILQASDTSFKLCDFGSAAPARSKPPSTMEEIKLLEADLNRSTTLQYRAPEMVDVYLRRPIDEKSDVWALGVLLYKLCYYTTPFEAHGPLAILHVQYSIPGYPVYSKEMNALIGCMLRELGVQRPSVFEVLSVVHRMRGTKSQYNYARPQQIPPSPSIPPAQIQDSLIQTSAQRAQAQAQSQREKQLREQKEALDAMNMRRGRPNENHAQVPPVSAPSAPPTTSASKSSAAPALPSRQPLAPLTRSRPSKSGGSRDSEKAAKRREQQQGADSSRKGAATPITTSPTTTTLTPSSPRKSTVPLASPRKSTATTSGAPPSPRKSTATATPHKSSAPSSPRKSSATPVKPPVGGVRVGPSSAGIRLTGTGTNGVKGLHTGGAKAAAKSPTADFFNDPSWKHSTDEKEKDIWGGETVSTSASPITTTTTNKFDGFADSFDGINGAGKTSSKLAGVGGVALPGMHKPTSGTHHSHPTSGTHHSHQHHHTPIQQPKTTRTATRDAFEGLGIPSAPSPALSLRELAARSPVPSPGIGVGHGGSLSPMPLSTSPMPSSISPVPLSTANLGVPGQSPSAFSRSPHPLTTGATTSTGVTGTLTTQATAGSATSGSKGALTGTGAKANAMALSAEERFPSIEELDAGTWQDKTSLKTHEPSVPKLPPRPKPTREDSKPSVTSSTRPGAVTQRSHLTGPNSHGLRAPVQGTGSRSQQVTGTAMKDPERVGVTGTGTNGNTTPKVGRALPIPPATTTNTGPAATSGLGLLRRPSNGGASPGIKRVASIGSKNREDSSPSPTPRRNAGSPSKPPTSPAKPRPSSVIQTSSTKPPIGPKPVVTTKSGGRTQSQTTRPDWLTGDFLETAAAMGISVPESPTKRSSALLGTPTGGGGGAGNRYQAPLKSPASDKLGRSTPDPLGRSTPNRLRAATSMTESSNDEGPEEPTAHYGRAKLERRGALTRSSPERKSRSSTLDVQITTGGSTTPTNSSPAHRRGPSENLIDLGPNNPLSAKSSRPVRTPSTASSTASHPPTSGPRSRRPQSMFIQAGTPISAALTPPVDPNAPTKRSVRRGSISDMVSRYEAMASPTVENQTTGSGGVQRRPSITPKPAGLRVPSTKVPPPERRRSPSPASGRPRSPEREVPRDVPITTPRDVPITTSSTANTSVFNRENRTRTSPTEMMRDVPIQDGNARSPSPVGRRSRPPSPLKMTHPLVQPTPARTSRGGGGGGLHSITPPHGKDEVPAGARAPSPPPSPDKPYQGVGRLIDQWQKKAGAEPGRPLGPRVGRR